MSGISKKMMQAAAGAGGGGGGPYLAAAQNDRVRLFDFSTGSLVLKDTYSISDTVQSIAFSPSGTEIGVAASSGEIYLLERLSVDSLTLADQYSYSTTDIRTVKFHPTETVPFGPTMAAGISATSNQLLILDYTSNTLSLQDTATPDGAVGDLAYSLDGEYLVVGMDSNSGDEVTLYEVRSTGDLSSGSLDNINLGSSTSVRSIAFSPDGNYIGVGENVGSNYFVLLDHTTPGSLSIAEYNSDATSSVISVAFSPDGNYIALGCSNSGSRAFVLLDHTTPGTLSLADTYSLPGGVNSPSGVSFSPDGNYIAVAHFNSPYLTVLDHTTPGTVTLAASGGLTNDGVGVSFSSI